MMKKQIEVEMYPSSRIVWIWRGDAVEGYRSITDASWKRITLLVGRREDEARCDCSMFGGRMSVILDW